jgi:hypothetical protein
MLESTAPTRDRYYDIQEYDATTRQGVLQNTVEEHV